MSVDFTSENRNVFRHKCFSLGFGVGAIFVLLMTAIVVVILKLNETHSAPTENETTHWDYQDQDEWEGLCNTGQLQSPINLRSSSALQTTNLPPLVLDNTNYFEEVEVGNNGHSVTVALSCTDCARPTLSGLGLIGNYTLDHLHFHWPSEHTIDDKYHDLEAHFVFYNNIFDSLESALLEPFAVTVVAVLFDETKSHTVNTHSNFEVLDDAVKRVGRRPGYSVATTRGITIGDFFPDDKESYFTYTGSLTTPACNENVNWIVLMKTSKILNDDLDDLVKIYTEEAERLKYNNRKLQYRNGRAIYIHGST